ncbi:hypothetical protein DPEC_G00171310 [Dallia pectoralis]|uniref:Uncharacterized protein n=1 Tax=Dallia pectoralis TaxID=75939 RepID=A0ACC2GD76_DALPE|nr:hypothetical protein DPEC_G00171310 [Dallia pectoralis]
MTNFFLKKQKSGADPGQTDPSPSVSCRSSELYVGGGQRSQEEKDDDTQEPSVSPAAQASHVHQKDQVTSQDRRMKNLFSHVSPGFHEPHLESLHGHSTAFVRSLRMTSPDEAELGAYLRMDGIPGEEGDVQGINSSTTDNGLYRRLAK